MSNVNEAARSLAVLENNTSNLADVNCKVLKQNTKIYGRLKMLEWLVIKKLQHF